MNRPVDTLLAGLLATTLLLLSSAGCTQDAYEKGEGRYSRMQGDLAEAEVNAEGQVVAVVTDDGAHLPLTRPLTASWITRPDTLYRCLLYYNKVEIGGTPCAEVVSFGPLPVMRPVAPQALGEELKTDPVRFTSAWLSRTGRYLNLHLQLLTGTAADSQAVQRLALVAEGATVYRSGRRTAHLVLHHDQGGVPQYYSTEAYVSIPVAAVDADTVSLRIKAYSEDVVVRMPIGRPASDR